MPKEETRIVDAPSTEPTLSGSTLSHDAGFPGLYAWQWHIKAKRFCWYGDASHALPSADSNDPCSPDTFLDMVSPEDRSNVSEDVNAALSGISTERDITFCPNDRKPLRLRLKILPVCDCSAEVVSILGFCYDDRSSTEKVFCKSAALLAQAEEITNFGTWEFDVGSRCGTVSPHLAQMLGIAHQTRLSEQDYWGRIRASDRGSVLKTVTEAIAEGTPFQYVARYHSPTKGTRYHLVRGIPNFNRNGDVTSIIGITFDFTDQNRIENELHRLSQKLLNARDEERRGMARELHESTGQTLAAVKMSLARVREVLPEGDDRLQRLVQSAFDLAENAIREIRTLSYLMHPPTLDEAGLRSAVQWYAKGFTERSGIPIQVSIPEGLGRYRQEVETTLFRIVQEALTNIHRYSGSRTATIRLSVEDRLIHAVIQDDGCGLPIPGSSHGRDIPLGVGIVGMRERVKQLNGKFEVYSAPGKGTTVCAALPLDSSSRAVRYPRRTDTREK